MREEIFRRHDLTHMLLIPYARITCASGAPPDAVIAVLQQCTTRGAWPWQRGEAVFRGTVGNSRFRLSFLEAGMNTYAPWIRGRVVGEQLGSRVEAVMTIHPVGVIAVTAFAWLARGTMSPVAMALFLAGFHVVMCVVGFWPTARRAEAALTTLVSRVNPGRRTTA